MKKVGIIINPHARQVKKLNDPLELYTRMAENMAEIRLTNSVEEIDPLAREFKSKKIDLMAVCGGDGTFHHVLSRFINVYGPDPIPMFLHLKAGTMNTASRSIKLKSRGPQILQRLVKRLKSGKELEFHERDLIKVYDKFCFLFGIGMTAHFLAEYYKGPGTGPPKALKVIMRAARGSFLGSDVGVLFDRVKARVTVDGEEIPYDDYLGVLAATVKDIGIGFKPMFRAYEEDGTFHTVAIAIEPSTLVKNLYKVRTGKPIKKDPKYFESLCRELRIESEQKMLYTMDGDLYEATGELVATVGPRIRLVKV